MQDLIGALGDNEFKLEEIIYNPDRGATARAKFRKFTSYDDSEGNDVSGNSIDVIVDYSVLLDHMHRKYDEDGQIIYDYDKDKAVTYINALMHRPGTQVKRSVRMSGGHVRSKSRARTRSKAQSKAQSKARSKTRSKARS